MVDLIIDYSLPENDDVFVRRKSDGVDQPVDVPGLTLKQDLAVLSFVRNPYQPERWVVSCAGVRGQDPRPAGVPGGARDRIRS